MSSIRERYLEKVQLIVRYIKSATVARKLMNNVYGHVVDFRKIVG